MRRFFVWVYPAVSGSFTFQSGGAQPFELLDQFVIGDIPDGPEDVINHDQPRFDLAVVDLLVDIWVLGQFLRVEVDIAKLGGSAEVLIELPVDGDGDLFQRPARSSAAGTRVQVARAEYSDGLCLRNNHLPYLPWKNLINMLG